MSLKTAKTRAAHAQAQSLMPLGVSSNFRHWGDESPVIERGEGAYIWDLDGNRYIDYRLAFGPVILGHAHPAVNQRVVEQLAKGVIYAHTHPLEMGVAERIIRMCPGVEKVRFANSGSEATMHALRIARGYTGREKVLKFEGQYHGMHDGLLWSTGSPTGNVLGLRRNPIPVAGSAGIPRGMVQYVTIAPFNDTDALDRIVRAGWGDLAAIILDPTLASGVLPEAGFLEHIRALCDEYGIVLIFDEVKTGFRLAKGGAAEYFGVQGDLMTYAKALANGFPLAAIGGKAEVMDVLGSGGVGHGGTYCGNAVGTAAADATLDILETTGALETIARLGERFMDGIGGVLSEAGVEHVVTGHPAMFSVLLGIDKVPRDYRDVIGSDVALYERLAFKMRAYGVEYDPDVRDGLFVSAAHTEADIDETLNKLNDAVKQVFQAGS